MVHSFPELLLRSLLNTFVKTSLQRADILLYRKIAYLSKWKNENIVREKFMFREFLFHFGFYQMIIIIIAYNGILIKLHTINRKS